MYLDLATSVSACQESTIHDFARESLSFGEPDFVLSSRYVIPLFVYGDPRLTAQTNICLLHRSPTILLVVQEDKIELSVKSPESQVIA